MCLSVKSGLPITILGFLVATTVRVSGAFTFIEKHSTNHPHKETGGTVSTSLKKNWRVDLKGVTTQRAGSDADVESPARADPAPSSTVNVRPVHFYMQGSLKGSSDATTHFFESVHVDRVDVDTASSAKTRVADEFHAVRESEVFNLHVSLQVNFLDAVILSWNMATFLFQQCIHVRQC